MKAVHILSKPLPRSVITLIFKNIFKADSLSCYITVTVKILELLNKKPPYLIKIFLKSHNHLDKLFVFPVGKMCYLKSYVPQLVRMTHSKLNKLG